MARARAADYEDKRTAILETAARVFADGGYDRTSMAHVSQTCGVSKALLYHYYASKEDLLFDLIRRHLEDLLAAVMACESEHTEPEQKLRALIGTLLDMYRDADAAHKVQITALASLPEAQRNDLLDLERTLVQVFAKAVEDAAPNLTDNPNLLKPATMSLFGMLNWLYMWFRDDGSLSREAYADVVTALFLNGAKGLSPQKSDNNANV